MNIGVRKRMTSKIIMNSKKTYIDNKAIDNIALLSYAICLILY